MTRAGTALLASVLIAAAWSCASAGGARCTSAAINDVAASGAARTLAHTAARAAVNEARAAAGVAKANLQIARSDLDYATRETEMYRPLVDKGAEPAATLLQLIAARDHAAGEVALRQAELLLAQRHVATLSAIVADRDPHASRAGPPHGHR